MSRLVLFKALAFVVELVLVCCLVATHMPIWMQAIGVFCALIVGWRLAQAWSDWKQSE